jgi:hypothetical protein
MQLVEYWENVTTFISIYLMNNVFNFVSADQYVIDICVANELILIGTLSVTQCSFHLKDNINRAKTTLIQLIFLPSVTIICCLAFQYFKRCEDYFNWVCGLLGVALYI